ncbi:MAG: AAA family ATPase, partial [Mailhella sp.]|nr:AAA family ATPase [Mailhella sp.]
MARMIFSGVQDFAKLRETDSFYVDKTAFLRDWWLGSNDARSDVTLITRPRRFGKTLMMSTVEHFFSIKYSGRADLFDGLDVWKDEAMRAEQGAYPVIFLSLAELKPSCFEEMLKIF